MAITGEFPRFSEPDVDARPRKRPAIFTRTYWSRRRVSRLLLWIVCVWGGLWLFYILAANAVLKTHALRNLMSKHPEKMSIEYANASTWFPGQFEVDDFLLRIGDDNIEMALRLDHAEARASIGAAFSKRFEATHVRAKGMSLRIRMKIDPKDVRPEYLAAVAPIEGFATPPIKPAVKKPPPSDAEYNLVTVQLEDIDVEGVRDVWIDELHYTGDTHVTGRFYLKPIRRVEIGPAHADIHSGQVKLGEDMVSAEVKGTADVTMAPFDPRESKGALVFDALTARVDVDGKLQNARFANYWIKSKKAHVEGGSGPLHSHVVIEHGVIQDGSQLTATANDLSISTGEWHAVVAAQAVAEAKHPAGDRFGLVTLSLPSTITRKGWEKAPMKTKTATVTVRSDDLDMTHGFENSVISADVAEADVPDIRVLTSSLAKPNLEVMRGSAIVTAHGDFDPKHHGAKGDLAVSFHDFVLRYEDKKIAANVYTRTLGKLTDGAIDLTGSSIQVADVAIEGHDAGRFWFGRADITKGQLILGNDPLFDADVATRGRDGRPLVAFLPQDYPDWVTGLFALDGLTGHTHVRFAKDLYDLGPFEAQGGDFHVDGRFLKKGEHKRGAFLLRYNVMTFGIGVADDGSSVHPLGAMSWFKDQNVAAWR